MARWRKRRPSCPGSGRPQLRPLRACLAPAPGRRRPPQGNIVTRFRGSWRTGYPEGLPCAALYGPEFSAAEPFLLVGH